MSDTGKLQQFLQMFQKAGADDTGHSSPPDRDSLMEQAFDAIDSGELSDDANDIANFSQKAGLSEADSSKFAEDVLFSYYGGAADAGGDEGEPASDGDMAKSILAQGAEIDLHTQALARLIEIVEELPGKFAELQEQVGEINTLKSRLAEYEGQAGDSQKRPDNFQKDNGGNQPAAKYPYGVTLKRIMKGVSEGILNTDDVQQWELAETLTDPAREYVDSVLAAAKKH